jgi:cell division septal protein FtsQ
MGGYFGATWQGFNPKAVRVQGNVAVSTAEILQRAAIKRDRNLWFQNPTAIARRIEAIPYIDRVWVHRRPPANVTIVVRERAPYSTVQADGQQALIDHDLRVLATDPADPKPPVFILKGSLTLTPGTFLKSSRVVALRSDNDALAAAHIIAATLAFDPYDQLIATLPNGIKLLLGDDNDLQKKIPLIKPILAQLAHGKPFSAVDLRSASTPVVIYK